MKCSTVYKYLTTEWEPSVALDEEVQNHLAGCSLCRAEQTQIEGAFTLLSSMPQVEPTAEFRAGWRNRVREEAAKATVVPEKRLKWNSWLKPAYSLAFLFIAVVAVIGYQNSVHAPKNEALHMAEKGPAVSQEQTMVLRSAAVDVTDTADTALYELKLVEVGTRSRDVQRFIRNFRSSHEEGIVFSHKAKNEEWTLFRDLSFEDAERLRKELEGLGARVEVKPLTR